MNKIFNLKNFAALAITGGVIFLAGCSKEKIATTPGSGAKAVSGKKMVLNQSQARDAQEMYSRMPKLRYWDAAHNRFIEMNPGSRDLVFSDPDAGFVFDDADGNGAVVYSDGAGDYLVVSTGIGVAGQGGGGTVVAGSTALDIDVTVCLSADAVSNGDGYGDLFDSGFGFTNFSAVFGISGDFEGLANANTGAEDFDPFEYLHGFAAYYVLSDDVNGSHEVFDWLDSDGSEDYDDLASSYVMDFQNFALYFASSGEINVSGGQMSFNGTYVSIEDLFDSFLSDGLGDEEPTVTEVSGFGTMGCN
jgi:hypothetical protein